MPVVKMTDTSKIIRFIPSVLLLGLFFPVSALAQQVADTTAADTAATGFSSEGGFLLWELIGEAQGFQYPIFGILVVGLFLVFEKLYELYMDRKEAEELEEAPVAEMDMRRITMLVANQKQSMLADLQASMINVYQTTREAATLHEEIANYIQFQRDRFDTFKRRVDFLSDTAGAIGLLGTVWGMFTVFSGNIDNKEAILGGMGVALVSTLLGLVVSIILNLSSTEVYSFFDKRIDQIEDKADELRFRLMELGMSENGQQTHTESRVGSTNEKGQEREQRLEPAQVESSGDEYTSSPPMQSRTEGNQHEASAASRPKPVKLEVDGSESGRVGSKVEDVRITVISSDGSPMEDVPLHLKARENSGTINEGRDEATIRTNRQGTASFEWNLPTKPGECAIVAGVQSDENNNVRKEIKTRARPGEPTQYSQSGNNQGATIGNTLPKPLGIHLLDQYDNPVQGQPVRFKVETGDGKFKNGDQSIVVTTGENGKAETEFEVGEDPGLNTISASVGGEQVKFQAMTIES